MRKLLFLVLLLVASCGGVDPKIYDAKEPHLTLKGLFDRNIELYGFYQGRDGKIQTRYYVQMTPSWNGNNGTLREKFFADDGSSRTRQWNLIIVDDNHFTATATDVDGVGHGEIHGYTLKLNYTINVPHNGSTIALDAEDWIYLQPDGTAINQVKLSKFGFNAGEMRFIFRKLNKGDKFKQSY